VSEKEKKEKKVKAAKSAEEKAVMETAPAIQKLEKAEKKSKKSSKAAKEPAEKAEKPVLVATTPKSKAAKAKVSDKSEVVPASAPAPSHDEIAHLAHRFWRERGGHHGSHEQDWLRAERELRGKAS
jgi:hypothetical protein